MAAHVQPRTKRPAAKLDLWKAIAAHSKTVAKLHLRQLFRDDPKRGERMTVEAVGLYLDYSKNRVTDETVKLLLQLAEESGLRRKDQCHGKPRGAARGLARTKGCFDSGRWKEHRA